MSQKGNVSFTSNDEYGDLFKNISQGCFQVGFYNTGTIPKILDKMRPKNIKLKRSIDKFKLNLLLLNEANQYWGKSFHSNGLPSRVRQWYSCTKVITGYNKSKRSNKKASIGWYCYNFEG